MQYIIDSRYVLRDKHSMKTQTLRPREMTIELTTAAVSSRASYKNQRTLQIVTLRNFRVDEELIGDYGLKYWLE